MIVEYDPLLVEAVVHELARADARRWLAYRRQVDPLYERADREATLPAAHFELFRDWGAHEPFEGELVRLPAARALVARSRRPGDEESDLLVGDDGTRTVLLRVSAERCRDAPALRLFLRHELRHVADMLDPAFGYRPDLGLRGRTRAELDLARARYRVLWDHAIDQVEAPVTAEDERRSRLARAFVALSAGQRARLERAFSDPAGRTHARLCAAAGDPWAFLGEPRGAGALPGQPCPLCGFPTFDWDPSPPEAAIRADVPGFCAAQGCCRQCADIWRVVAVPG
jgi:hypothetical protein